MNQSKDEFLRSSAIASLLPLPGHPLRIPVRSSDPVHPTRSSSFLRCYRFFFYFLAYSSFRLFVYFSLFYFRFFPLSYKSVFFFFLLFFIYSTSFLYCFFYLHFCYYYSFLCFCFLCLFSFFYSLLIPPPLARSTGLFVSCFLIGTLLIASAAMAVIYFRRHEIAPDTKRAHLVQLSFERERQHGETEFEQKKRSYAGKILPPLDTVSVRVEKILTKIVKALQHGLKHDELKRSGTEYSSDRISNEPSSESTDEIAFQLQESSKHLQGLNWEVIVVMDDEVNAVYLPGGKIVVFTGLLDHFQTDEEIATVIAHEVGHGIARHGAEDLTRDRLFTDVQLTLLQFIYLPDLIGTLYDHLVHLPFSRRTEMEADRTGLMLLAASGHDPCIVPKFYEKLGKITGASVFNDYLSTHPSGKKRAESLSQAQVMDKALQVYRDPGCFDAFQYFKDNFLSRDPIESTKYYFEK